MCKYEEMRLKLLNQVEMLEADEKIKKVLSKKLPNHSDRTDYGKWLDGTKRFAEDNKDVLMSLVNEV